jgi:hypothetical protein
MVTAVLPLRFAFRRAAAVTAGAALLALAPAACSFSNGGSAVPPGFSTSYAPASDAGPAPVLRSVSGSGAGNGWAVGELGLALALTGDGWVTVPTGSTATLGGLSVLDVYHAYAVELGGGRVLAWDGRQWGALGADRAGRAAAATWASAIDDVWVAGDGIEHWDGKQWTQQVPPGTAFTSIAGSFDTDVWAVGPTTVHHWDGKAWAPMAIPTDTPALAAVWVTGLYDAWVVGAAGTVLHFNGNTLVRETSGTTADLTSVGGTGPTDIWIGARDGSVLGWNGAAFVQLVTPAARPINDLWKPPFGDLLLVDDTGTIVRYVR